MLSIFIDILLGFILGIFAHWLMNKKNRIWLGLALKKILMIKEK